MRHCATRFPRRSQLGDVALCRKVVLWNDVVRRRAAQAGILGFVFGLAGVLGCGSQAELPLDAAVLQAANAASEPPAEDVERRITAFCSDCHALPRPESLPRERWYHGVKKGYEYYAQSGRNDLDPPPLASALAYYRSLAPEEVAFPEPAEAAGEPPVKFTTENLHLNSGLGVLPEIANLQWTELTPGQPPVLVACDMRYGHVVEIDLAPENRQPPALLAQLRNPCHAEPCDLDGDGNLDLVVADLGSFLPAEHDQGRVVWLRRMPGQDSYTTHVLAAGLGRVAEVRPIDVDNDGRLELLVAEFGWHLTGRKLLLVNTAPEGEMPQFEMRTIDDRPGTIHMPVHDFDGDGRLDFAALISQEYEAVELFLGRGEGRFARRNVWSAPDLTFGSSGLEIADIDGDGDSDLLLTNGDAFDNGFESPWGGVHWLENRGQLDFQYHKLTTMPGAYRALPADFDGDGDQDVLAVAFLPRRVYPKHLRNPEQATIVLLEQTSPREFRRYTLERGTPYYATLAIGDFDRDGDQDFVVGSGPIADGRPIEHFLTIWWNQRAAP